MAQVIECCGSRGNPGLPAPQTWLLQEFGEWTGRWDLSLSHTLFLSLCVYLSVSQSHILPNTHIIFHIKCKRKPSKLNLSILAALNSLFQASGFHFWKDFSATFGSQMSVWEFFFSRHPSQSILGDTESGWLGLDPPTALFAPWWARCGLYIVLFWSTFSQGHQWCS